MDTEPLNDGVRHRTATPPASRRRRPAAVVAAAATCLALGMATLGCGGGSNDAEPPDEASREAAERVAEELAESGAGDGAEVDIDTGSGQVDVSTDEGEASFGEGTELPADFPDEIPFPDDYQLTSVVTAGGPEGSGWTLSGELAGATDSTFDELVARFTDAGFTVSSEYDAPDAGLSSAQLDNGTWTIALAVQVGMEGMPDSFTYAIATPNG
jgi:hypothetical protein